MENFEIEIKVPIENMEDMMERLLEQEFRKIGSVREEDTYYNSEYYDVKSRDEALRIRRSLDLESGKHTAQINFKGKKIDRVSMSRREYETEIEDPERMNEILTAVGFLPAAAVRKMRIYLSRREMTACLDQVEGLGDFLELEVIIKEENLRSRYLAEMEELLGKLGLSSADTVRTSYLGLLAEKTGSENADIGEAAEE